MKSKSIFGDPMNYAIFGVLFITLWLLTHFAKKIVIPKIAIIVVSIIGIILLIWLLYFLWKVFTKSKKSNTKDKVKDPVPVKTTDKDEKKPDTKPATKRGFWRTGFGVFLRFLFSLALIICTVYVALWLYGNYGNQFSAELSDPRYRMIEKYEFTEDNIGNYIAVNMKFSNYDYEVRGGTLEGFDANGGKISLDNLRKDFSGNQFYNLKLKPESFSSESRRIVLLIKYPRY